MCSHTYEIAFAGEASPAIRAEFDDCEVIPGLGGTVLRATLPDQAALSGLLQRVIGLRLELTWVLLAEPGDRGTTRQATGDLTFDVVNRLFSIGLDLTSAHGLVGNDAAGDRIAAAIRELDRLIAKIRVVTFAFADAGGKGGGAGWPGWMSG